MRKLHYTIILGVLTACSNSTIKENIIISEDSYFQQAENMFYTRELEKAYSLYLKSYNSKKNKITAYKLATCHTLFGNIDSAFFYLEQATSRDSSIYLLQSGEYFPLIKKPQWDKILCRQLDKYQSKFGKINNIKLTKRLFNLSVRDQAFYLTSFFYPNQIDETIIKQVQSENIKELENIIIELGWPKSSEVCLEVSSTAFLLLQHADLEYQKKYFSDLYNCVIIDEASQTNLAYLIDKINVKEGRKQIYGTQLHFDSLSNQFVLSNNVYNPENIDKRRSAIKLEPISDYIISSNDKLKILN